MTPEQFLAVARCMHTPMLLVESGGLILAANPAAAFEFQRPPGELCQRFLASVVTESVDAVRLFLRASSRSRERSLGRLSIKSADGRALEYLFEGCLAEPRQATQPALLILHFRPQEEGRNSFIALNRKIDQLQAEVVRRKRLENERTAVLASEKAARLAAERASRAKDEFLAIVSHELRAPLNVINGWIDLLVAGHVEADEYPEVFATLQRSCEHQIRLIEDILDTSRVITGKLKISLKPVDVASIVDSTAEAIRATAAAKNIAVFVSASRTVGPVSADPDRLQQVVWNLLTNAVKFSPKGSRIVVSVQRVHSNAEIKVSDEGEGIDAEFLPFVFERFRQEDGAKTRPHGGLGLGLGIVRHIVELHGGTVAAASAGKGQGACFTISLPLLAVSMGTTLAGEALTETSRYSKSSRSSMLAGLRILAVDDEIDARSLIARILELHGAEVVTAGSAKEALAHFLKGRFDLVVSDIGMPDETGYDLIKKIRLLDESLGQVTPAAAISGFAAEADCEFAITAGFHVHLAKPVDAERLIEMAISLGRRGQ